MNFESPCVLKCVMLHHAYVQFALAFTLWLCCCVEIKVKLVTGRGSIAVVGTCASWGERDPAVLQCLPLVTIWWCFARWGPPGITHVPQIRPLLQDVSNACNLHKILHILVTRAWNGNLEVPACFLKAKQVYTVRKIEKDKQINDFMCKTWRFT